MSHTYNRGKQKPILYASLVSYTGDRGKCMRSKKLFCNYDKRQNMQKAVFVFFDLGEIVIKNMWLCYFNSGESVSRYIFADEIKNVYRICVSRKKNQCFVSFSPFLHSIDALRRSQKMLPLLVARLAPAKNALNARCTHAPILQLFWFFLISTSIYSKKLL